MRDARAFDTPFFCCPHGVHCCVLPRPQFQAKVGEHRPEAIAASTTRSDHTKNMRSRRVLMVTSVAFALGVMTLAVLTVPHMKVSAALPGREKKTHTLEGSVLLFGP